MTSGWNEVDGIAQIAAATGTLVLAAFTWRLARRTHELAVESKGQVEASEQQVEVAGRQVDAALKQARATESLALEARTDRQLAWQPQLELRDERRDRASRDWFLTVRNSGAGPALDVVIAVREMADVGDWGVIRCVALPPRETYTSSTPRWPHGGAPMSIFVGIPGLDDRRVVTVVMMCTDVLGRKFRFGVAEPKDPYPGEVTKVLPVEVSVRSTEHPDHVGWAAEPLIWG